MELIIVMIVVAISLIYIGINWYKGYKAKQSGACSGCATKGDSAACNQCPMAPDYRMKNVKPEPDTKPSD